MRHLQQLFYVDSFMLACGNIWPRYQLKLLFLTDVIKFLRSGTWLLFGILSVFQVLMMFLYWPLTAAFLADTHADVLADPFNIHLHLVATIFILIEIFVAAFPIRMPHFIYPSIVITLYIAMTVLLHEYGTIQSRNPERCAISTSYPFLYENETDLQYPFLNAQITAYNNSAIILTNYPLLLDWGCNSTFSIIFSVCIIVFGTFFAQLIIFGLHLLRVYIYKLTRNDESLDPIDVVNDFADGVIGQTNSIRTDLPQCTEPTPQDYF